MHASTRKKAIRSLDGMAEIVAKEMLVKGDYVGDEIDADLKAQGAICGGHKYCAIGSLWAGAGIHPKRDVYTYISGDKDVIFSLPGVTNRERDSFLDKHPGLKVAYDALNEAAEDFISEHEVPEELLDRHQFSAAVEALFEGAYADDEWNPSNEGFEGIGSPELLEIIEDAKQRVAAAA